MDKEKTILKKPAPRLVAIVGGSGAGKTFLASKLKKQFEKDAVVLSLDDFYTDLSDVPMERRCKKNFDDPKAIDWVCLEKTLKQLMQRKPARVPCYDFSTHCRRSEHTVLQPKAIVIVDGLWLLRRPSLRRLFDVKIFLECATPLRFDDGCGGMWRNAGARRIRFANSSSRRLRRCIRNLCSRRRGMRM